MTLLSWGCVALAGAYAASRFYRWRSAVSECVHGIADPDWCVYCKQPPTTRPGVVVVATVPAAGTLDQCEGCNLPIHEGQPIDLWSDGLYRHHGCTP